MRVYILLLDIILFIFRQWIVERFNLFSIKEIEFSTNCILEDMRNNSAWNYRYFIGSNLSNAFKNKEFVDKEVELVKNILFVKDY